MTKEHVIQTEHPYIVKVKGICGGRPIIKDTRTPVQAIVEYYRLGMNTAEILTELPYLTEAQLHDALSYFHAHKEEILTGLEIDHELLRIHHRETNHRAGGSIN